MQLAETARVRGDVGRQNAAVPHRPPDDELAEVGKVPADRHTEEIDVMPVSGANLVVRLPPPRFLRCDVRANGCIDRGEPLLPDQRPNDDDCGLRIVYRLDGTATENCMGADHQRVQATARWSGATLVLTVGTVEPNGTIEPWQLRFTLTLNDDGTLRAEAPWGRDHAMIASVYRRVR